MPREEVWTRLTESPVAYGAVFVLGALLGSFANVCILRIPAGKSIVSPGSHCFACGAPVRWYDNVPILAWLWLRGRCRACQAPFSPRYLLVEAATALLLLATYHLCLVLLHPEDDAARRLARFGAYGLFVLTMVVITFIDLDHKRIPDKITYPAIPLFAGLGLLLGDRVWWDGLVGVAIGYGIVRAISDGYYLITKREGLGYGDGKLLAIVGGLLGWRAVLFGLFGGSLLGSVIGVSAVVWKRRAADAPAEGAPPLRHVELPFGPFLCAAALVYLFLQDTIHVTFARFFMGGA